MVQTLYTAGSELRRPGRFVSDAVADLRRSARVAWALFRSNLRVRYRRSWFGYLWLLLPAIGAAAICAFMRGQKVFAVSPTQLPYPLFVLAGMILWQSFVEALNMPLQHLAAARQTITRSPVPHEAVLLAGALELALNAAIRLIPLAAMIVLVGTPLEWSMLAFPLGIGVIALLGVTAGLLLAPLGMLYDDVGRALLLGTGFLFFLTPVLYPIRVSGLFRLNLVAPLLDTSRGWLAGGGVGPAFLLVTALSAVTLPLAWLFYRLARPHVAARLG
jgi:lipopolysaccharide transport system permease protein